MTAVADLAVRGWVGPGQQRLAVEVPSGQVREAAVPDTAGLLRRVAGLAGPWLWVRVGGCELREAGPGERARAGLGTVDGRLPRAAELTVLDLVLAGRPLRGRLGLWSQAGRDAAEEREAQARALAGRLGLGALLDEPASALEPRAAVIVDVARALLGEPRALVAALPGDPEAAAWVRARMVEEAASRHVAILLLREAAGR